VGSGFEQRTDRPKPVPQEIRALALDHGVPTGEHLGSMASVGTAVEPEYGAEKARAYPDE
jgi:hypothetical protein